MAEFVEKSELEKCMTEDWVLENLAAQDSKSSIRKEIRNVIDNLPTTTEAELRANVIDEFAERMQRASDWIETYTRAFGHTGATIRETVKEIASQMKGEKECQE